MPELVLVVEQEQEPVQVQVPELVPVLDIQVVEQEQLVDEQPVFSLVPELPRRLSCSLRSRLFELLRLHQA